MQGQGGTLTASDVGGQSIGAWSAPPGGNLPSGRLSAGGNLSGRGLGGNLGQQSSIDAQGNIIPGSGGQLGQNMQHLTVPGQPQGGPGSVSVNSRGGENSNGESSNFVSPLDFDPNLQPELAMSLMGSDGLVGGPGAAGNNSVHYATLVQSANPGGDASIGMMSAGLSATHSATHHGHRHMRNKSRDGNLTGVDGVNSVNDGEGGQGSIVRSAQDSLVNGANIGSSAALGGVNGGQIGSVRDSDGEELPNSQGQQQLMNLMNSGQGFEFQPVPGTASDLESNLNEINGVAAAQSYGSQNGISGVQIGSGSDYNEGASGLLNGTTPGGLLGTPGLLGGNQGAVMNPDGTISATPGLQGAMPFLIDPATGNIVQSPVQIQIPGQISGIPGLTAVNKYGQPVSLPQDAQAHLRDVLRTDPTLIVDDEIRGGSRPVISAECNLAVDGEEGEENLGEQYGDYEDDEGNAYDIYGRVLARNRNRNTRQRGGIDADIINQRAFEKGLKPPKWRRKLSTPAGRSGFKSGAIGDGTELRRARMHGLDSSDKVNFHNYHHLVKRARKENINAIEVDLGTGKRVIPQYGRCSYIHSGNDANFCPFKEEYDRETKLRRGIYVGIGEGAQGTGHSLPEVDPSGKFYDLPSYAVEEPLELDIRLGGRGVQPKVRLGEDQHPGAPKPAQGSLYEYAQAQGSKLTGGNASNGGQPSQNGNGVSPADSNPSQGVGPTVYRLGYANDDEEPDYPGKGFGIGGRPKVFFPRTTFGTDQNMARRLGQLEKPFAPYGREMSHHGKAKENVLFRPREGTGGYGLPEAADQNTGEGSGSAGAAGATGTHRALSGEALLGPYSTEHGYLGAIPESRKKSIQERRAEAIAKAERMRLFKEDIALQKAWRDKQIQKNLAGVGSLKAKAADLSGSQASFMSDKAFRGRILGAGSGSNFGEPVDDFLNNNTENRKRIEKNGWAAVNKEKIAARNLRGFPSHSIENTYRMLSLKHQLTRQRLSGSVEQTFSPEKSSPGKRLTTVSQSPYKEGQSQRQEDMDGKQADDRMDVGKFKTAKTQKSQTRNDLEVEQGLTEPQAEQAPVDGNVANVRSSFQNQPAYTADDFHFHDATDNPDSPRNQTNPHSPRNKDGHGKSNPDSPRYESHDEGVESGSQPGVGGNKNEDIGNVGVGDIEKSWNAGLRSGGAEGPGGVLNGSTVSAAASILEKTDEELTLERELAFLDQQLLSGGLRRDAEKVRGS